MSPPVLAIARLDRIDAAAIGGVLRSNARVTAAADGVLVVAPIVGQAIALGAFQRARSTIDLSLAKMPLTRRSTGGPAIEVGEGQLFLALDLARADLFGGVADPNRALNRHLRPLLRALSSLGVAASYGGRDFIASRGAPVAWCGLRHRIDDGSVGIEIVLALNRRFTLDSRLDLAHEAIAPRWLGRAPTTVATALTAPPSTDTVLAAIVAAYAAGTDKATDTTLALAAAPSARDDEPPFDAMTEVPIGLLGAARDNAREVHVGGDWMVSEDAPFALEVALSTLDEGADEHAIGAIVDRILGPASAAMLIGVPRLDAVRKVIAHARQK